MLCITITIMAEDEAGAIRQLNEIKKDIKNDMVEEDCLSEESDGYRFQIDSH